LDTIGVVGLGNMGSVIAEQLNKQFEVIGFDIDKEKRIQINGLGIKTEDNLEGLAKQAKFIILSMPNAIISTEIVKKIIPFMQVGSTVIETSTILPAEVVQLREICIPYKVNVIDAAILGGVGHMKSKTADLLVGDSDKVFEKVLPILKGFSKEVQLMGTAGSGMAAKIINNGVAHAVMSVIVESSALGVKLGIDPESIYELLSGETALQRPLTHRYHERIQEGNFSGGMSTENAKKDSKLFLNLAQENGVPLFTIQSAHTVYEVADNCGYGKEDYSSIAKLWEEWSNISFKNPEGLSK